MEMPRKCWSIGCKAFLPQVEFRLCDFIFAVNRLWVKVDISLMSASELEFLLFESAWKTWHTHYFRPSLPFHLIRLNCFLQQNWDKEFDSESHRGLSLQPTEIREAWVGVVQEVGDGDDGVTNVSASMRKCNTLHAYTYILNSFEGITAYNSLLCHISSIVRRGKEKYKRIYNHQFRSNPLHEAH